MNSNLNWIINSRNSKEISLYCHDEIFDEKFDYRELVNMLLNVLLNASDRIKFISIDDLDEWDSMKELKIYVYDELVNIYWERELGHITAYCSTVESAIKLHEIIVDIKS